MDIIPLKWLSEDSKSADFEFRTFKIWVKYYFASFLYNLDLISEIKD